ncbi:hypothetical protein [Marininema halotolerans]|uniref:Uncharacterized protein n=1 Tax=Marininema halotolerans TaxID=1155944 RepID=A0A1I6PMG1_9BACL|nr:hypothetical protein [Marininema halotolerans]SFS41382.1 hypothetical protein SAMN05444972_10215 [Marininema halotolerans]
MDDRYRGRKRGEKYSFDLFLTHLQMGHEIEFSYKGEQYAACKTRIDEEKGRYVLYRFYDDSSVQHFESVEFLRENAVINGEKLKDLWEIVEVDKIF